MCSSQKKNHQIQPPQLQKSLRLLNVAQRVTLFPAFNSNRTVNGDRLLRCAERVRRDALIVAVVGSLHVVNVEAHRDLAVQFVVRLDLVFVRRNDRRSDRRRSRAAASSTCRLLGRLQSVAVAAGAPWGRLRRCGGSGGRCRSRPVVSGQRNGGYDALESYFASSFLADSSIRKRYLGRICTTMETKTETSRFESDVRVPERWACFAYSNKQTGVNMFISIRLSVFYSA